MKDWQKLTELTGGKEIIVEKVRLAESGIKIEGNFELPPLGKLSMEDQIFVAAFVKSHGSIKEMERLFGVSYPSIKNRLNKLSKEFDFIEVKNTNSKTEILERLSRGEIKVQDALKELKQ